MCVCVFACLCVCMCVCVMFNLLPSRLEELNSKLPVLFNRTKKL